MDVKKVIDYFDNLKLSELSDQKTWETKILPDLGLNDELLHEFPPELHQYCGTGLELKVWQYPNQFSKYLTFLNSYANKINSYLEIGARFGGTYICHTEMLRRCNPNFCKSVPVDGADTIEQLREYERLNPNLVEIKKISSFSQEFKDLVNKNFFDVIFVDGGHMYEEVLQDWNNTKNRCNIQVFHDITNQAVLGVNHLWNQVKLHSIKTHEFYEFTDQYDSVNGFYLGIGVAVRKDWI